MRRTSTVSQTSIRLRGKPIPEATDRQKKIPNFDQQALSKAQVLCIGAGGLISHIAPTLARKGVGGLTILDHDIVEPSNLNRQRFYLPDVGCNKAIALAQHLERECIYSTRITGFALRLEEVIERRFDLNCDIAICGVDNNPARTAASRHFRERGVPVIFVAVSANANHGYVFLQEKIGPCFGCLFPDAVNDAAYPCPGTPAVADILQLIGAMAIYVVDSYLMPRRREWNYRSFNLEDRASDSCQVVKPRNGCLLHSVH